jgi:adenylate cyclase
LQDRITVNVVTAIAPRMLQAEIVRAQAKPTTNLTAYDFYLRGFACFLQDRPDSLLQATSLLKRAVHLDPGYSSAHGLIANCHAARFMNHAIPIPKEELAEGLEAAKRAVETGRSNAEALARGGLGIAILGGKPNEALIHAERALVLNPNSLAVVKIAAIILSMVGAHTRALELHSQARRVSPLDPWAFETYLAIAMEHLFERRFLDANSWAEKALVEKLDYFPALVIKAASMAAAGLPQEEVGDVVQNIFAILPDASIAGARQRLRAYREADAEVLLTGLRRAGIPEG